MSTCPTCGRRPSERVGMYDWDVGNDVPWRTLETCPDPLHDRADQCDELEASLRYGIESALAANIDAQARAIRLQKAAEELAERYDVSQKECLALTARNAALVEAMERVKHYLDRKAPDLMNAFYIIDAALVAAGAKT